jgi:3D domain
MLARAMARPAIALLLLLAIAPGCASRTVRTMEVTAYCGCGKCSGWYRGSWWYLKLDFWNRYVSAGPRKGQPYSGLTASGTKPRQPHPGLFSVDTVTHPWKLPFRLLLPWLWLAHDGTIAADTRYYPFGTRMYIPGWGPGRVEDRGGAIKGPRHIDIYFDSHSDARSWGRRRTEVEISN